MKMMKFLIGMMAMFVSVTAMASDPTISDVMVQQRWPWSRLVDIDYMLTCDPEQSRDINVEAYDGSSLLALPSGSFSGDLYSVQRGARRIVWDPTTTAYTNNGVLLEFRVELSPAPVPLYMIVDLTMSAGDEGQIEYVYESDLTNGLWGAWVRNPVTNRESVVESVAWIGVTTNDIYKTNKLVLRRILKGAFTMGGLSTTLTKDFYAGVFQVTQRQWELITGTKPSYFKASAYYETRPVEQVSYHDIRGATNDVPSVNWPVTGTSVLPLSFLGLLRAKTGLTDFDLPTEAQWEYACCAGTDTWVNDGDAEATGSGFTNVWLNALGKYRYNDGFVGGVSKPSQYSGPDNGTAPVGIYLPNAWGLYDMHGNVYEWCRDWRADSLEGGDDPKGADSGSTRMRRGGAWGYPASYCGSASRSSQLPHRPYDSEGLRLVRALP